jgi:outer membrane protein assembly factor BamB
MHSLVHGLLSVVVAALPDTNLGGASASWPTFRGPDRSGVSKETGLLQSWPEEGPKLVWRTKGAGRGYASLAIADGRMLTLGDGPSTAEDDDEYLVAFSQIDGKPLWKLRTGAAWTSGSPNWQSSRSTPTIAGDAVYVLTPFGDLVCAGVVDGKERWRKNLEKDFEGKKGDKWGYSESVLIDGDHVICTPGGEKNTMVALDKKTGKLFWSAVRPGDRGAGHASIVISEIGGKRVYVQTTGGGALGVQASDGKLLWSYEIEKTTAVAPTPIVRGDLVFFSAGYKRGGALLKQAPGGETGVQVEEIYPLNKELANKHGGIVLVGDYLYGDSDDQGIPFCADLMTGEIKWKSRTSGRNSAALTAADGRIYVHSADGTMSLVKADPEKFEEVGTFKLPDAGERPGWMHPVVFDGKLYIREQDEIFCYDVKAK